MASGNLDGAFPEVLSKRGLKTAFDFRSRAGHSTQCLWCKALDSVLSFLSTKVDSHTVVRIISKPTVTGSLVAI